MAALAVALYAVWRSLGVTSCQRELKSFERRVNALCNDVIRGELSVTDVSVEELKIQIIKYQAEQQRMQSAMKENRDALVKWFGGEL
jgi:hypothetical protein